MAVAPTAIWKNMYLVTFPTPVIDAAPAVRAIDFLLPLVYVVKKSVFDVTCPWFATISFPVSDSVPVACS